MLSKNCWLIRQQTAVRLQLWWNVWSIQIAAELHRWDARDIGLNQGIWFGNLLLQQWRCRWYRLNAWVFILCVKCVTNFWLLIIPQLLPLSWSNARVVSEWNKCGIVTTHVSASVWGTTDLPLHILPTVILHYVVILMYCRGSFIQNSSSSLTDISKIILVDIICQCV